MEFSTLTIVIGVVGSVASVVALLIAAPGAKSKIIHVAYALALTVLAAGGVAIQDRLNAARSELDELHRTEREAGGILKKSDRSTEGSMIGLMLAGLSFLEKHKGRFPETYARAVKVCEGSGMYTTTSDMSHFVNLQQGSSAMYYLLLGIAASDSGTQ